MHLMHLWKRLLDLRFNSNKVWTGQTHAKTSDSQQETFNFNGSSADLDFLVSSRSANITVHLSDFTPVILCTNCINIVSLYLCGRPDAHIVSISLLHDCSPIWSKLTGMARSWSDSANVLSSLPPANSSNSEHRSRGKQVAELSLNHFSNNLLQYLQVKYLKDISEIYLVGVMISIFWDFSRTFAWSFVRGSRYQQTGKLWSKYLSQGTKCSRIWCLCLF